MGLESKVIVTIAPVGSDTTPESTPHIPLTPRQVADDVYACWKAGASVAHIHARDDKGQGTMDHKKFAETVKYIRETGCDIVLNLTTSGAYAQTDEVRYKHLVELKPELASFDCGSMNWAEEGVFENSPQFLQKLGKAMQEINVKPEIECFDPSMIHNAIRYEKMGILKAPLHFQFVMGVAGGMPATVENLAFMSRQIPEGSTWSAFGTGKHHLPILYATIALGGHIRIGLEDSIYYSKNVLAKNIDYVERTKRIIKEFNKEIATPDEARQILGLKK